ncbi:hypothetical protein MKX01_038932 [Papaver californicum]|nr:hypothetical protein MKX01_038932 [Papaver californicum]
MISSRLIRIGYTFDGNHATEYGDGLELILVTKKFMGFSSLTKSCLVKWVTTWATMTTTMTDMWKKPLKLSRPTLSQELGPVLFAHL